MMNSIGYYFKKEYKNLIIVTITGLIYNIGLVLTPYFEGQMAGCLLDILQKKSTYISMVYIVGFYLFSICVVQFSRFLKRNYVRVFANNTNARMKQTLYHQLIGLNHEQVMNEGVGNLLTKALNDVDDCSEGMRKFTTEIFDTGIALCAYICMLFYYDFKLARLCLVFTPFSYILAEKMKKKIQQLSSEYKRVSGVLNEETLDRANNAITYRVYGREENRKQEYETILSAYEKSSIQSNLPIVALPPLYKLISLFGVFCIVYFGSQNVIHSIWNIAAFTTFLSCFSKMADKSSKAAKLFNSVHKAQVSWNRIKSYMQEDRKTSQSVSLPVEKIVFKNVSFHYSNAPVLFENVNFELHKGQIFGVTGCVACGKSTLGKLLLGNLKYDGNIFLDGKELKNQCKNNQFITYLGHDPQLLNDTVENNIALGKEIDVMKLLRMVCLDDEVGLDTEIGDKGMRLSGGQAQRLALARALAHKSSIIVLDDPFSSLDVATEKRIFKNIQVYCKDAILILISHRLNIFDQFDNVLYLENKKSHVGSHTVLMDECAGYKKLVKAQGGETNEKCTHNCI